MVAVQDEVEDGQCPPHSVESKAGTTSFSRMAKGHNLHYA